MIFLHGALLGFLGALGLPVLVHLLTLRRRRALDIPTLRFLREIESTRIKRVRLTRWWLLLARLLFLAALVLAFARPVLESGAAFLPRGKESLSLLLLLDDSASSRLPAPGGRSAWETARAAALERLQGLEARDRVWLGGLADPGSLAGPLSPDAARRRLAGWSPSWAAARLDETLEAGLAALERDGSAWRQLVLLSDLRLDPPGLADSLWPRALPALLVPLPTLQAAAAPQRVELRSSLLRGDRPLSLDVELAGEDARPGLTLSVVVEEETRASHAVGPPAGSPWTLRESLEFRLPEPGWLRGRVEVAGDPLSGAVGLPFVLRVPQQRRVLLCAGDPAVERAVAAALVPDERYGRGVELLRTAGGQLSRVDPASVDQVVLGLGQPLPASDWRVVRALVAHGARLLVMPAPDADPALADRQARELGLPGVAGGRRLGAGARVEGLDRRHEILADILEEGGDGEDVAVSRLWLPGDSIQAGGVRRTLASAGGLPVLQALESAGGRALWLGTPPREDWSSLAASGLWAPLMQQGLRWLDGDERLPASLDCGAPGRWTPPRGERGAAWTLEGAGRSWRLPQDLRRGWLELPALPEPGHYQVRADARAVGWVAARVPAGETVRSAWTPEEWAERAPGTWRVQAADRMEDGEAAADLSPWLLLAALLLLAWEGWLARGGGRT
jgi:hypothetical protein